MNTTNFWQMAGLVVNLIEFGLYLAGFAKYKKRLEQLAEEKRERANGRFEAYKELRDKDADFYSYYKSLPDYAECESNVLRGKGAAAYQYGSRMRSALSSNNGYQPLRRAGLANYLGGDMAFQTAMRRTQSKIAERSRVDEHVLNRWSAIVGAPTNPSRVQDSSRVIQSSFRSLGAFGKGANNALSAAGISLYRMGF